MNTGALPSRSQVDSLPKGIGDLFFFSFVFLYAGVPSGLVAERHW